MLKNLSPHFRAVFQVIFVTFLWSTSWVFVKIGLKDIPALTFGGLRYTLAFVCLIPFALRATDPPNLRRLSRVAWARLFTLGFFFYAVTQGAVFLSLSYLPANTTNLLFSFSTVTVALLGVFTLYERATIIQWIGVALHLGGVLVYFYPASLPLNEIIGLIVAIVGVFANALSSILGRHINRSEELAPITVTVISMGIGSVVLLAGGILAQGLPHLSLINWAIIAWLAVVNTAFTFTLWNRTLHTLSAMESTIINSLLLFEIPILAYIFLGEHLTWRQGIGMVLAAIATLVVQIRKRQLLGGRCDE